PPDPPSAKPPAPASTAPTASPPTPSSRASSSPPASAAPSPVPEVRGRGLRGAGPPRVAARPPPPPPAAEGLWPTLGGPSPRWATLPHRETRYRRVAMARVRRGRVGRR